MRIRSVLAGFTLGVVLVVALSLICGCGEAPAPTATATAGLPPPPPPPPADAPAASESTPPVEGQPAAETASAETAQPTDTLAAAAGEPAAPLDVFQVAQRAENPFGRRIDIPEFTQGITWLNTKPLTKADLKGKFVLFDFWTYCCINCMHILPELKKLERQYPKNLVVIGVHSAKFQTEKDSGNIRDAVMRYEIEHPVINDADHSMWNAFGINSWPSIILVDPEGKAVSGRSGEFKAAEVQEVLNRALPYYRQQKLLEETPLKLDLEASKEPATPLRFPGKILADEKGNRLFISDSNHNRIVVTDLGGKFIQAIGSGDVGSSDGDFQTASFDHPQGCALAGETLYVADTENHNIRKVDLTAKKVTTVAGTGQQASNPWPGFEPGTPAVRKRYVGPPKSTALSSPWALFVHEKELYIAMAGCHQIWKMPLDEKEIGPYAGNALEDIVNGDLLPREPFAGGGASSFAQPSGLSGDGSYLYVADSEGSSIRKVPFKKGTLEVGTVVGSDHLPRGQRLFAFGDKDGPRAEAKLQHCLGVDYLDNKLYVADTYNHKIKVVNAKTGETHTVAGTGEPGKNDGPPTSAQFHEPAGLDHAKGQLYVADTNNHLIRVIDLATNKVSTLTISGLEAPGKAAVAAQQ
jgi:DNA-binding beta-propeller fold protein YncE